MKTLTGQGVSNDLQLLSCKMAKRRYFLVKIKCNLSSTNYLKLKTGGTYMIKVCDAIMGTGKSSAAITYMNEHREDKFIYITPYLEEAERIKKGCPGLKFVEPSDKLSQYHFKKSEHTAALIKEGKNITTTHQAFKMYSQEMLDDIRKNGYRLIIDENIDVLEKYECSTEDIQIAVDAGYIKNDNGTYKLIKDGYNGIAFRELFKFLKVRELVEIGDSSIKRFFYWVLPPSLITSFKEVIVLTYLFTGQSLHHFLKICNLPYEYIGIQKENNGSFRFCEYPGYIPEYVTDLGKMIHILDNDKMNSVGNDFHSLSKNWYITKTEEVDQLKKNIYNCMNNIWRGVPSSDKLWGCYKSYSHKVRGKGYSKSFLTFNARSSNAYRDKRYLIYVVNLFMNVSDKAFYQKHGIEVDEDAYALSIMVQWIWRSAIRDGDEVYLYIPSKRMRDILTDWINETSKGGIKNA